MARTRSREREGDNKALSTFLAFLFILLRFLSPLKEIWERKGRDWGDKRGSLFHHVVRLFQ